jgi:4-alpha-glucanotransferase
MTESISLALVVHNHQPVGNFDWVIDDVFKRAYEPMINALERHERIRMALHYTGPLLEWMDTNQPQAISRLKALVDRGQVEILGGGQFEPILVALPERDRRGQLVAMRDDLARRFGTPPAGAWLAERVWEPSMPFDLASAGYTYTVLDDNHLRAASVPEDAMWGTFSTDDRGRRLTVLASEKGLRYRIPWRPVPELIEYLHSSAVTVGDRLGVMGDDGEKFGAWPGTYELCWAREAWIEQCFTAIEDNAAWLRTVTPSEWMADHPPVGRIYVPATSYVEMTEWALPPAEANVFHRLLDEAVEHGSPAARFLRGGFWRNFQARYREVNSLEQQMLRVSSAVAGMPAGEPRERALDHLYRGQSNDCYWHGLFGGIYIVHMRMATLAELIAAEDVASGGRPLSGVADYDLDGVDEVMLGTRGQTVLVDVAEGAGIDSWDLRAARVALGSVLRRRPEAYHETLRQMDAQAEASTGDGESLSPHEQMQTREAGLSRLLVYDDHERRSALARVTDTKGGRVGGFVTGDWTIEKATERRLVVTREAEGLTLRKTISLEGSRLRGALEVTVELRNQRATSFAGAVELEWNVNLMGGGGNPAAYYRRNGRESRHDGGGRAAAGAELAFGNRYEGVALSATADPPAPARWYPVETVSNSEAGFERVYQGSCLTYTWRVRLAAGKATTVALRLAFSAATDRMAAEDS